MANQSRRVAIKNLVAGTAALGTANVLSSFTTSEETKSTALKGHINHAVCRWCYGSIPLDEFAAAAKKMGISAIDLVGPKDWPTLQKYGIYSSMCNGAEISLTKGWSDKQYPSTPIKNYAEYIDLVAKAGYKTLICLSGNTNGRNDDEGWKNCVEGLKQIMSQAEQKGVT